MALDKQEHRLDAERAVLGSLLIDPDILRDVLSRVDEHDFLNAANLRIFRAAKELFRSSAPVDAITLRDRIGPDYSNYLVQLMEITPTSANWEEYARIMHEQAAVQRIRSVGDKLTQAATLEDCRPLGARLSQLLADGRQLKAWTMPQLLESFYQSQDPAAPPPEYITCGLRAVDDGVFIEPGDVVMIGGYPSDGKTALALQIAWHMAERRRVGFFSLETGRKKLRDRLMSNVAQLQMSDIKLRTIPEKDWKALAERQVEFSRRSLTVLEAAGMTATDIQATARAYDFQIIFLDYIQLVTPETTGNRSEQMAAVSRAMHTFAQRSGTLVVELAQLLRQERGTTRDGKVKQRDPTMHDLKESGQFEQDADLIFLLSRPSPSDATLNPDSHRILQIAKNKEGRWGSWPLCFDGGRQTFRVMSNWQKIMRSMVDAGKAAQSKKAQTEPEYVQTKLTELPGDDPELPF